jgi:hypothetical protein
MDVFALSMRLKEEGAAAVKSAVDKLRKSFEDTSKSATSLDKSTTNLSKGLKALLGAAVVGATIKKFATETSNAMAVQAELAQTLRSTGQAANFTIKELNDHAVALQKVTTFGDEAVGSAQAILLRFGAIGKDIFPKATEATADLAAAMKTDMASAAQTVGRALQAPEQAARLLRSANIILTQAQQDTIKSLVESGQKAKAQAMIFAELERATGGQARALRNTLGGALTGLANQFGDLFELTDQGANSVTLLINKFTDLLAVNQDLIKEIINTWLPRLAGAIAGVGIAWVAYTAAVKGAALWTAAMALSTGQWWAVAGVAAAAIGGAALTTKALGNAAKEAAAEFEKLIGKGGAMSPSNQSNIELTTTKIVDQVAALMKLVELVPVTRVEAGLLAREERTLQTALSAGNLSYAKRLELTERLLAVQKARESMRVRLTPDELMAAEFNAPRAAITGGLGSFRIRRGFLGGEASLPSLEPSKKALEKDAAKIKARSAQAVDQARVALFEQLEEARVQFANAIAETLIDSFAAGIERAVATGSIGEGFKALGQTLLSGLGSALQMFGKQAIVAGVLMERFMAAMATMNPVAAVAAGIGMVALGAMLKGAAQASFGGGNAAPGNFTGTSLSIGGGMQSSGSLRFMPTTAGQAGQMQPKGSVTVNATIIGPNDPSAQRQIADVVNNAARRGLIVGAEPRTV